MSLGPPTPSGLQSAPRTPTTPTFGPISSAPVASGSGLGTSTQPVLEGAIQMEDGNGSKHSTRRYLLPLFSNATASRTHAAKKALRSRPPSEDFRERSLHGFGGIG